MNADGGHHDHEQGSPNLPSQPEASIGSAAPPKRADRQQNANEHRWSLPKKLEGFSPVFEFAVAFSAIMTLLLLIVQVVYMGASNRMTRESNDSARESNASSDRTAKETLRLMEESNRLTRESNRLTQEALKESKAQAEASRTQSAADAAASLEMARKSLEESRRTFEMAQRARLAVENYELAGDPVGRFIRFTVRNTGVLPATEVRWVAEVRWSHASGALPELPEVNPQLPDYDGVLQTVIGGGQAQVLQTRNRGDAARTGDIMEDAGLLFFHGLVEYQDGFGNTRSLRFCAYSEGDFSHPGLWQPCVKHNKVD